VNGLWHNNESGDSTKADDDAMKGNRIYLAGTICGTVGMIADFILVGVTPAAAFHTSASQWERIAACSFAALGYLVALISARKEKANRR
jgi:hypothetical protein